MGPTHPKSPLLPKDGFPYLPHSFMLWKPVMMAKRGLNTIKLPTETAELGTIINTKQRNHLTPGDLGQVNQVSKVEEGLLGLFSLPAQDSTQTSMLQMWSLVHMVYTFSVLTLCPSTADLPSASSAAGFYTLSWSLWISGVTRSQLDPMLFNRASLCCFHRKPWTKVLFLTLGDNTPRESRVEGERDGPKRTLWLPQFGVKTDHKHWGHTSVANAVVSPALGRWGKI